MGVSSGTSSDSDPFGSHRTVSAEDLVVEGCAAGALLTLFSLSVRAGAREFGLPFWRMRTRVSLPEFLNLLLRLGQLKDPQSVMMTSLPHCFESDHFKVVSAC